MTKTEALKLVTMVGAAFPRAPLPQPTVELYLELLQPLDVASTHAAILAILDEGRQFPPSFGEIRQAEARVRQVRPTTEEAWGLVKAQVRSVGSYGRFEGHRLVAEAVDLFGWQELCRATHDQDPANRAHFYRTYESVCRRADEGYLQSTRREPLFAPDDAPTLDAPRRQVTEDKSREVLSEIMQRHEQRVAVTREGERKPYADD